MESIDVVSEVKAFRQAMRDWAKDYAAAHHLEPTCSIVGGEAARADFRRWSRRYVAPVLAQRT